ncbi:MAG: CDP-glycerol glycerophosphotransferase family protein [Candidatus Cloacimonetes bacterium]|nr:CDP-glycerol glycerophosphotransferase family protein [Candidatus Cloacimonadota bacterium]
MKPKHYLRSVIMELVSLKLKILALLIPTQKGLILFGSYSAVRFGDSSAALFNYIKKAHPEFQAVWMTNSNPVKKMIEQNGGCAYKRRSLAGIWLSLRAEFAVSTHGVKDAILFEPIYSNPKFIYLGHGIPLKKGWIQIENAPKKFVKSSLKKVKCSSFMISTSPFAAELQNHFLPIGINKIKITGLPRNDILLSSDRQKTKKIFGLESYKKVICYAPTFRMQETIFLPFPDADLKLLNEFCTKCNICLVFRPHHNDIDNLATSFWKEVKNCTNFRIITQKQCSNVNELLVISDCLVTDYSSIYFDFLLLNRPLIFLPYDLDTYRKEHGFIVDYHSVTPGYKPKDQKEFLNNLKDIMAGNDNFAAARIELCNKIHCYLDSNSCLRVTEEIKRIRK